MDYDDNKMVEENTDRTTVECEFASGVKVSENWTRTASSHEVESDLLESDGLKVTGGADFQNKYGEHQKVGAKLDIESPDMGGVRAFVNLGAERKFMPDIRTATNKEDELSAAINLTIQGDTHIGASLEKEGGETKKLNVQAVYEGFEKGHAFVRADTLNKWVSTGCSMNESKRFNHTYEAVYGYGDKSKTAGVKESPVWLRFGARYNISDSSSLVSNYLFAKHMEKNSVIEHKIDDHWKMGVHYHYDERRKESKDRSAHEFGYSLHYEV